MIAGIELFLPDMKKYNLILQEKAQGLAAALIERENAIKAGLLGVKKVAEKSPTRPISPNITKPRPPQIPEPQKISTKVILDLTKI